MAKRILFSVLAGILVVTTGGFAVAGYSGSSMSERPVLSSAEIGQDVSFPATWQEREALETGALPAMPGDSPGLRCCDTSVDAEGNTSIRPEIDSGS